MKTNQTFLWTLFAATTLFAGYSYGETVILPNSAAAEDTPDGYLIPFAGDGEHFQFVYKFTDLLEAMPNGALITGFAFRNDAEVGTTFDVVVPEMEVKMSSTLASPPTSMSPVFSENIGPDYRTVFERGSLPLKSTFIQGIVHPFDIKIPFTNPYYYNPKHGRNLLIETIAYDAPSGVGIAVDRAAPLLHETVATNGQFIGGGPAIELTFTPVPEPTITALAIFLIGSVILFYRKKTQ